MMTNGSLANTYFKLFLLAAYIQGCRCAVSGQLQNKMEPCVHFPKFSIFSAHEKILIKTF